MNERIDSYCGLSCKECSFKAPCNCKTCIASEGNPFFGTCELADCAKSRSVRFCGECGEFPCELLTRYSYDKEHGDNGARIQRCKDLKAMLVKEARVGINPVSVCGHHCNYCFLGQWCGGCRSDYNCCSFAMLFDNGICPNVACAKEKGLDGCYDCEQLRSCKKGFYEKEDNVDSPEFVAKTTALFIHEYGKDTYTKTLQKAIDAGENYPKSFDEMGSVEGALELLHNYL